MRQGEHANIIPEGAVMVDRQGREWFRSDGYQDRNVFSPGWLELQFGELRMTFYDVLRLYGFLNSEGNRFLVVARGYPPS